MRHPKSLEPLESKHLMSRIDRVTFCIGRCQVKAPASCTLYNVFVRDDRRYMAILLNGKPKEEASTRATLAIGEFDFNAHSAVSDKFRWCKLRSHGKTNYVKASIARMLNRYTGIDNFSNTDFSMCSVANPLVTTRTFAAGARALALDRAQPASWRDANYRPCESDRVPPSGACRQSAP